MTLELAKQITSTSVRCTQATLRAFGINTVPKTGSGVLSYLRAAGYDVKCVSSDGIPLNKFKFDNTKNYYLCVKHHAIALIQGILIDTALGHGKLDKRPLLFVFEVSLPAGGEILPWQEESKLEQARR